MISGINYGYNIASDIQYSATVGAALEGAFMGVQSIAFSRYNMSGAWTFGDHTEKTSERDKK